MTQSPTEAQDLGRMPPQAVEVEQAVLGAMMLEQRAIVRAVEILDESCFYHAPHSRIFAAMADLFERGIAVDQLTLTDELKRRGQLDDVGGVVYLAKLGSEVATTANTDFHARIVLDKALGRKLIETSSEVIEQVYAADEDVQTLLDSAEQKLFSLSENQIGEGFELLEKVMGETFEHLERVHAGAGTVLGVDTGFADLNDQMSGFQKGRFGHPRGAAQRRQDGAGTDAGAQCGRGCRGWGGDFQLGNV